MIKFIKGNLFDYEADILVNTVNCVGVMGKGIALEFKRKYPKMFNDYRQACFRREVQPGYPHVWIEKDMFNSITIINFPTKTHWRKPSEYEYVEKGLMWLKGYLTNRTESITLPALGCSNGGLDWIKVKSMITKHLSGLDSQILVVEK